MKKMMNLVNITLLTVCMQFAFADAPDWEDNPGGYEFTSYLVSGIVLDESNSQMGGEGDVFAAFDTHLGCLTYIVYINQKFRHMPETGKWQLHPQHIKQPDRF